PAPPSLARQPPADDELLAHRVLHLEPGPASATHEVAAVQPLGDQSLESPCLGEAEERLSLAAVRGGGLPVRSVELELLQTRAAFGVRGVDEGAPVDVQNVEDHVGHRYIGHPATDGR